MTSFSVAMLLLAAAPASAPAASGAAAGDAAAREAAASEAAASETAVYLEERVESVSPGGETKVLGRNRIWITKDRVRVERGSSVQVYDARSGFFLSIDGRAKTWYRVPADALRRSVMVAPDAMIGMTVDAEGDPAVPEAAFRKTERRETVGGRTATVWETAEPDVLGAKTTLWFAGGLPVQWTDLQRVVRDVFVGEASPLGSWFDQAAKMEGWPVRIDRVSKGRLVRTELLTVERRDVAPSLFEEPGAGYTRVSDPSGFTYVAPPARSERTSEGADE